MDTDFLLCSNCRSPVTVHGKQGPYIHVSCSKCGMDSSSQITNAVMQAEKSQPTVPGRKSSGTYRTKSQATEVIVIKRRPVAHT